MEDYPNLQAQLSEYPETHWRQCQNKPIDRLTLKHRNIRQPFSNIVVKMRESKKASVEAFAKWLMQ